MTPVPLRDVMVREYVGLSEGDDLREAVGLMRANDADAAVVLRGDEPVGLLTARTVLDCVADGGVDDASVGEAMDDPPASLRPEATLADAADALRRGETDHLLVVDGSGILGIVGARDLTAVSRTEVETVPEPGTQERDAVPDDRMNGDADRFSEQSVCEVCGGLAGALTNVNGQLVCADCQDV